MMLKGVERFKFAEIGGIAVGAGAVDDGAVANDQVEPRVAPVMWSSGKREKCRRRWVGRQTIQHRNSIIFRRNLNPLQCLQLICRCFRAIFPCYLRLNFQRTFSVGILFHLANLATE